MDKNSPYFFRQSVKKKKKRSRHGKEIDMSQLLQWMMPPLRSDFLDNSYHMIGQILSDDITPKRYFTKGIPSIFAEIQVGETAT